MSNQKRKFNPIKIPIFMMIGAIAIMFTDLVLLDGQSQLKKLDLTNISNVSSQWFDDNLVSKSGLRAQHKLYLDDGVEIPEEFIMARNEPRPMMSLPSKDALKSPPMPDSGGLLTLDEILDREREEELALIEPAAGVIGEDGENYDLSISAKEERLAQPQAEIIEERDVNDIIADLRFEKQPQTKPPHPATEIELNPVEAALPAYDAPKEGGRIVIIIDDMGLSLRSRLVEILPGPLTLAYLPYAENLPLRTKRAHSNGHELMVHMPMEPMNRSKDGGPHVLSADQSDKELLETLQWGLSQFEGFAGVNNHMGSRVTQDAHAMSIVMQTLKERDLYFVDSKTIGSSVAAKMAHEHGLPYAVRDIFLDHEVTPEFIRGALEKVEQTARYQGYAIAIGHPHKETISALKEWLPTLEAKGLTLVPASAVLKKPAADGRVAATQ